VDAIEVERVANAEVDLEHHGDTEALPGLLDFATNVRLARPPAWLRDRLAAALDELGTYPAGTTARQAVADLHRRRPEEVLLTAGGAEAFTLLARALRPSLALCLHPSFTEPELALRRAGHRVERLLLAPPFRLDPAAVRADADLIVLGNPTNPTSVLHPREAIAALSRPGRIVVVDEAFADCVPGEPESLAGRTDLPGLVVTRSLTKTWGLSGLRVGYLLAEPEIVAALSRAQPPWPVSSLAQVAVVACLEDAALLEAQEWARRLAVTRTAMAAMLAGVEGVEVVAAARASFLVFRTPVGAAVRERLRGAGIAVRRGDTFPGLGLDWTRVAVRDPVSNERLAGALDDALATLGGVATARQPS
jgi:histidinol-phosphate aminotransferase